MLWGSFWSVAYPQQKSNAALNTPFEKSKFIATATYVEGIAYYSKLDSIFTEAKLLTQGVTDSGKPLHLFLISKEGLAQPNQIGNRIFVLILNAIHPGESDGVDASMLLARELLLQAKSSTLLDSVVIGIIPFYNIGGALNRGCCSRANQNGPIEYGFRGNARNYDLNRDFIKADTRNTRAFQQLFTTWKPHFFMDTHVSNGADYSYTVSYIASVKEKLGPILGNWFHDGFIPALGNNMKQKGEEIIPYVDFNDVPEKGMHAFYDAARYSTGYAALFHTPGFMIETHMLKAYKKRVFATKLFMEEVLQLIFKQKQQLQEAIYEQRNLDLTKSHAIIDWKADTIHSTFLEFKGYESRYIKSKISGLNRLYYDQSKPFTKAIPYFNRFLAQDSILLPEVYLIPAGWHDIVDLLKKNDIYMYQLEKDTAWQVESYHIGNYQTTRTPYEGHYLHSQTRTESRIAKMDFSAGDYVVPVRQSGLKYLIEVLEPRSKDSFFNWNYFDIILQPKEGFSDYVFEETAENLLIKDSALKAELLKEQQEDSVFAKNHYAQLEYIYKRSPNAELAYKLYPIYRSYSKWQNRKLNE